ncbi:MAG TPA: isochorismatase family protein [Blastococcus sp.]
MTTPREAVPTGAVHSWDDVIGVEEHLVARGYAGERQVRGRRALVLVDLYNRAFGRRRLPLRQSITEDPSSCGTAAWDALPALGTLLDAARTAGVPVVHTVAGNAASTTTLRTAVRHGDATTEGGPSADWADEIVEPLMPREGETVVAKNRASAFFGTTLDTVLRRAGVEALVVAGETTSGCVRATVVDAYSLGFDVVVVEDATFDRSPLSHKVSLFDMHCKYATVVDVARGSALLRSDSAVTLRAF